MGLSIVVKGADFSSLGLGNINLSEIYIASAGITNTTHKTAIRAFYASFKAAGFLQKFGVARLYFAGTALADSINLVDPQIGTSHYQATFANDSASYHTSAGWTPNATAGSYANSNFPITGDINNFHAHAWNTTAESNTSRYLLGTNANSAGNAFIIGLQRKNSSTNTQARVAAFTSGSTIAAPGGYDTTKTGLLSVSRQAGGVAKLYDGGVAITTTTVSDTWSVNGATKMYEGAIDSFSSSAITACTLRFVGYGFSTWTDADETALQAMLVAFNTAIA